MNTGSAIALLVILVLLVLAVRHVVRHGTCSHCDRACRDAGATRKTHGEAKERPGEKDGAGRP